MDRRSFALSFVVLFAIVGCFLVGAAIGTYFSAGGLDAPSVTFWIFDALLAFCLSTLALVWYSRLR